MNKKLCSGHGRSHTNNPENPRAKPLLTIDCPDGIVTMSYNPQTALKRVSQWFIASTLLSRSKAAQMERGEFYCLVLDIDHNPPKINSLAELITIVCRGCGFLIYTSRSATKSCQKSHVIIPTIKLTGHRWTLAQSVLNDELENAGVSPDRKTEDANQIIYLPNRGEYYNFIHRQGAVFNPLQAWYPEMLKKHQRIETAKQAMVKKASQRPEYDPITTNIP